ncbi:MAG: hypothetical protein H7062_14535, partial [Candidatus Saccharimonas sp.]|nr:hypothetical protein [Planctomycetaceae bacterium]
IVVHIGTVEQGETLVRKYGLDEIDHVSDPERRVYRGLELRLGTLSQLFGVRTFGGYSPVERCSGLGSVVSSAMACKCRERSWCATAES